MKKTLSRFLHLMLIAFIISIAQTADAQDNTTNLEETTTKYSFVVWANSGETFSYLLSEHPKVTQTATSLVLTTTKTEVEYPKEDVWKFTMQKLSASEIDVVDINNISITQFGNIVYLSNCKANSVVCIYSVCGILYSTQNVTENGTLVIDFNDLNDGVYIISTESITYKIIKR